MVTLEELMGKIRKKINVKVFLLRFPEAWIMATYTDKPDQRVVQVKLIDDKGLVVFTNLQSKKAVDISINPNVSMMFYNDYTRSYVRVIGIAEVLQGDTATTYWATRSQLKKAISTVSKQSKPIGSFLAFLFKVSLVMTQKEIKKPLNWGAIRILPTHVELFDLSDCRLNKRDTYTLDTKTSLYFREYLYP